MRLIKVLFIIGCSIFITGFWFAPSPLQATLSNTTVPTGTPFTYTLTIEGSFQAPMLTLPDFKHLKVVHHQQSRSYLVRKKKNILKTSIVFSLFSERPGTVILEPAVLRDGKRTYKTKRLVVKITGEPLPEQRKITPYIASGTSI